MAEGRAASDEQATPLDVETTTEPASRGWPAHDDVMSPLICAHHWAGTPLGAIEGWPERLKAAVDTCLASPLAGAVYWGPDLNVIYNDAAIAYLREMHPAALGRPIRELSEAYWRDAAPLIEQVLSTGKGTELLEVESWIDRGRGPEQAYLTYTLTPLRDEDGHPAGIVVTMRDVTKKKSAELALRQSEERLRLATEAGRLGTWDWDLRTNEPVWSPEVYRMLGYDVGEVIPSYDAWLARMHPEDLPGVLHAYEQAVDTRHPFAGEYRVLWPDGEVRWLSVHGNYFYGNDGHALRAVGVMLDVTERQRFEQRQQMLIAELQHRTRNLLAVVTGIARQTEQASGSLVAFSAQFNARLAALSRVQGLLSRSEVQPIYLHEIVEMELQAHGTSGGDAGVTIQGGEVELPSAAVQVLALALHELATNATKHGALAQDDARLRISWEVSGDGPERFVTLRWSETGVNLPSPPPSRRGFGRQLIESALPYELRATTSFRFAPDGVRCEIKAPL